MLSFAFVPTRKGLKVTEDLLTGGIKGRPHDVYTENTEQQTARMCSSEPQLIFMNAAMELCLLLFLQFFFFFLLSP